MSNATRTVREFAQLVAEEVYTSAYQKKNTETARLRQVVTTTAYYPSMKPTNSLSDNVFGDDEFKGTEEQPFTSTEQRVAFINVPAGTSLEEVNKRIKALGNKARIYRILSNHPILTAEQKSAISNGITTKEIIADGQAVRYPEDHPEKGGELILDTNGKVQYRAAYFSATGKEDEDYRTLDPNDVYLTEEMIAEMAANFENVGEPVANTAAGMQEA